MFRRFRLEAKNEKNRMRTGERGWRNRPYLVKPGAEEGVEGEASPRYQQYMIARGLALSRLGEKVLCHGVEGKPQEVGDGVPGEEGSPLCK